jgi:hypothetical protein
MRQVKDLQDEDPSATPAKPGVIQQVKDFLNIGSTDAATRKANPTNVQATTDIIKDANARKKAALEDATNPSSNASNASQTVEDLIKKRDQRN